MSNPFTAFPFEASGTNVNTSRTMPDRLSDIINVKDYGATGAGFPTDDWSAIMAAFNHGQITLVTTAGGSGGTLTFSGGVPASVVAGMYVVDTTTPGNLDVGVTVQSTTSTTVTLNGSAASVGSGETITFNIQNKGTIFFPPGNYYIAQPLAFSQYNVDDNFVLSGVVGASTISGNFSDYIFNRDSTDLFTPGNSGCHVIEKLNFVNTNATGGGIRFGLCVGGAIRDCNVTANLGINTGNTNELGSLEITIKNCQLSPGSNPSGSIGLMLLADGPVINCYINGFAKGAICWGNQGGQTLHGCRFELCTVGFEPGAKPDGTIFGNGNAFVCGCYFKNCGTAILDAASTTQYLGVRIDGANGALPGPSNPQYGIHVVQGKGGSNGYLGVTVAGQYDHYGVYVEGDNVPPIRANMFGVSSANSGSGSAWGSGVSPVANMSHDPLNSLVGCNIAQVTTVGAVLFVSPITSVTWAAGTVTLTFTFGNLGSQTGNSFVIVVSGVTVGGYNGTFTGTITGVNTLTYPVVSSLASSSGGNITINIVPLNEGDCINVSDADTSSWAAIVDGGSTGHAKVRYNGAGGSLTVVGI